VQGGVYDAFDPWLTLSETKRWNKENGKYDHATNVRSIMAAVMQSYELRIMMAILPVLKAEKQVYLLYWLHDGVCLHFGNSSKKAQKIRRLQKAVRTEARQLNVAMELEVEELTPLSTMSKVGEPMRIDRGQFVDDRRTFPSITVDSRQHTDR
jgi:hypothetical protein